MTEKGPIPTLQDVATRADVSTATVSRCLNFPDQVAKQTREKVMSAVRDLGYSPNFGAKALAARRTHTIGAIIPTIENSIFARGLQAFQEEIRRHGFTMLVASTSYCPEIEEEQIRTLVARGADALLLIGHDRDPEIYRFLETQGVPALIAWAFEAGSTRPSVGFDNKAAMFEMAREVISLGHQQIALITAELAPNDRAQARLTGIKAAMTAAGLDPTRLQVVETSIGFEQGAAAFEAILREDPGVTSIFCGNDVLAVGALGRARELGIKVPDDLSVLGFDDIELARIAYPPLTTVHVPHREMGRRAGLALAQRVTSERPLVPIELKTKPVFRKTLAPPRAAPVRGP